MNFYKVKTTEKKSFAFFPFLIFFFLLSWDWFKKMIKEKMINEMFGVDIVTINIITLVLK